MDIFGASAQIQKNIDRLGISSEVRQIENSPTNGQGGALGKIGTGLPDCYCLIDTRLGINQIARFPPPYCHQMAFDFKATC